MTHRIIDVEGREPVIASPGPAPILDWVKVDRLIVDDDYQRSLGPSNWKAIRKIAESFLWSRFQPLLLAPVEGGRFAIIDGQHRAHAALLCGIEEVPAVAVMVGREEQSRAFAWVNSQTIKVTSLQVYKAARSAGEDWAVRATRAVEAAGCQLMTYNKSGKDKRAGELYCVVTVRRLIEGGMDEALTSGLGALLACPRTNTTAAFSDYILKDWIPAVHASPVRNPQVLADALSIRNPFKVIEDAKAAFSTTGGPSDRIRSAFGRTIRQAAERAVAQ